ncbi:STAS domain-containing protein [Kitasatospora sp. SUK 42]|uniref:STAS domain-containing protein n=1 Tax=Kitasatospora sp. SUK 42 TaxID=1588882 RepID=UPI0018C8EF56|nr:STAS domain-containing protein [Kitasatospora sp. SUK 42]MBV2154707.1 STAS domain-containing protein [Kitasatospora sp. SUK 42]
METRRNEQPPTGEPVITCDLAALTAPDLAVIDALARLRLAAARHGVGVVLLNTHGPLRELLAFSGLSAVLPEATDPLDLAEPLGTGTEPVDPEAELLDAEAELLDAEAELFGVEAGLLGVEPGWEAEQREEHGRVEEVGEPGDPAL